VTRGRTLPRSFYARDPRDLAPQLLNKLLVARTDDGVRLAARLVEVEAYCGSDDPGSHAYRGMTPRTEVMFGPPGHLYVYFTYGMHWCSNVVCNPAGGGGAVLLRALHPLDGLDAMWPRRPKAKRERDLCSGPARLTQALALTGDFDGVDLSKGPVLLLDDGTPPPADPGNSVRIGLSPGKGDDSPWRWFVPGDPNVSRR
jgi:DNA-3-methyladenine glycosylase